MKYFLSLFLLISSTIYSQDLSSYYNSGNTTMSKKWVNSNWESGVIVLSDGSEIRGDVKAVYGNKGISKFKFRKKKGEDTIKIKAEECLLVSVNNTITLSLPKNLKKQSGKRIFYITMYYGKHLTILENPKASTANGQSTSLLGRAVGKTTKFKQGGGQMLSFLALKDNKVSKLTAFNFRKQIKKICLDNKKWASRISDKKWFKYDNLYKIVHFYNQTKSKQ